MRMLHEPHYRAMWHGDCEGRRFSSPMKPLGQKQVSEDGTVMTLWECVCCQRRGWWGIDSESRIQVQEQQP